ncbi:MAG: hypothetical protein AAF266_08070 [Planctomycetota bacterium]
MMRFVQWTYGLAAGALLAVPHGAAAQFVAASNYPPAYQQPAPTYATATPPTYVTPPAQRAVMPPTYTQAAPAAVTATPPAYAATPTPAYAAAPTTTPTFAAPTYGAPTYAAPRVAQAGELPTPSEAVDSVTPEIAPAQVAPVQSAPVMTYGNSYAAPTNHVHPSYTAPTSLATGGCATGDCGTTATPAPAMSYSYGGCDTGSCATGTCGVGYDSCYTQAAPACDLGIAPRRKRQWFAGVYGLYLDLADGYRQQVAYFTETAGFAPGTPYYYMPSDAAVWSTDADIDGQFGAEIRFGSTFGCDPCGCGQPFAWELGYWALEDESASSAFTINEPVGATAGYTQRLYGTVDYSGLLIDIDGAGTTWTERPANDYSDYGVPADGDVDANDVRVVGVRVRQRFQAQNLELNFWRFGTPAAAPAFGGGALGGGRLRGALGGGGLAGGAGACGYGAGSCGVGAGCGPDCGPVGCAPCRSPRRFFINGVAGVRYFRVDDDFGIDRQFTLIDAVTGDPPAGWPTQYESFPADDNSVLFHNIEADNELVGFQLGCSMNWLVGCNWNVFCDSNFGIYGNQVSVHQSIVGGGASVVTQYNGGGAAVYNASDTDIAFLGELRAGVGYQVSCNCRVTAAYRFLGVGGLALAVDQIPTAGYSNANAVQYVNSNQSIILHGLQTGVEWKY